MTKTMVDLDPDLLSQAREALGTTTIKETVNSALAEIVARAARRRLVRQLRDADGLDLVDPDGVRAAGWR